MNTEPSVWLVTGASRGIGLELVRQLATTSSEINIVLAACRAPASASRLRALKRNIEATDRDCNGQTPSSTVHIVTLDVADEASVHAAASGTSEFSKILHEYGLDYIVNNAAVTEGDDPASTLTLGGLTHLFATNVAGPALVAQSFLPHLQKGRRKIVANVSSGLASFTMDYGQKAASYSISKAAINMLTYKQAKERPDIVAVAVAPGWVKTDMGGPDAPLEPSEAVAGMLKVIKNATSVDSGKFINWDGEEIPW